METKTNLRLAAVSAAALMLLAAVPAATALENAKHDQDTIVGGAKLSNQVWWNFGVVSTGLGDSLVSSPTGVTPLLWVGATPVLVGANACPGTGDYLDFECGNGAGERAMFANNQGQWARYEAAGGSCNTLVGLSDTGGLLFANATDNTPSFMMEYTAYPTQLFGATGQMFSDAGVDDGAAPASAAFFTTEFLHVTYPSPVATLHFDTWVSEGGTCTALDGDGLAPVTVTVTGDGGTHDYATYEFDLD